MKYGTEDHTADLVFWLEAETRQGLFRDAPLALAELMLGGRAEGELCWRGVRLEAEDSIGLMVQLLNEAVYYLEAEGLAAREHVLARLTPTRLESRLGLAKQAPGGRPMGEPVKAVTYHQAGVEKVGNVWRMRVTLDV